MKRKICFVVVVKLAEKVVPILIFSVRYTHLFIFSKRKFNLNEA